MPSLTLLGQSVVSGLLAGGLYALLALGLSLSWGLLRLVNLSHFALALLGAYLTYQLGHAFHLAPWLAAGLIVPAFFALGVVLHVVFARFRVTEFTSLLVTFGLAVILESLIQWFWTADYRRYETPWASASIRVGPLFVPTLAPAQIWAWLGTVFAVVIIGGLGNPVGALLAGFLIGISESVTMAVAAPAWAPLVSFSILIGLLVLRPERV